MGSVEQQVIGVTGVPGAWTNVVATELKARGCQVLWPGQRLLSSDIESLYTQNGENPEITRIHDLILEECNQNIYSLRLPRFFSPPFPGPEQFLAKFSPDRPVVIVNPSICLVWDIWRPYVTDVLMVSAEERVTSHFLRTYIDANMTEDRCSAIFDFHALQLQRIEDSFVSKRYHLHAISNTDIENNRYSETIDSILKAMDGTHVR